LMESLSFSRSSISMVGGYIRRGNKVLDGRRR
jgi:hypothetical protein